MSKDATLIGHHWNGRTYCPACSPTNDDGESEVWSDDDEFLPEQGEACEGCGEPILSDPEQVAVHTTPPAVLHGPQCACRRCILRAGPPNRGEW